MSELNLSDIWASDETRKIQLTSDLWVEIKDELDHGEEQAMQSAAMRGLTREQLQDAVDDTQTQDVILMDAARLHFLKLAFYIIDWNLKDQQGRPITLPSRVDDRIRVLKKLKPAIGTKISTEIDALREAKAKELEAGQPRPNPESPPPTPLTEAMSRSGNTSEAGTSGGNPWSGATSSFASTSDGN